MYIRRLFLILICNLNHLGEAVCRRIALETQGNLHGLIIMAKFGQHLNDLVNILIYL